MAGTALAIFQASMSELLGKNLTDRADAKPDATRNQAILDAGFLDPSNHLHSVTWDSCKTVLTKSMPRRILACVKRQVRCEMRKPKAMKVRPHFQHLLRHNMEYLPNLPPFKANQGLPADELLDVPLCGTPKSW